MRIRLATTVLVAAAILAIPAAAEACSVCFGDPDSRLTRGAFAGVVTLIGIVGFVLVSIAGTSVFFVRRARMLASEPGAVDEGAAGEGSDSLRDDAR